MAIIKYMALRNIEKTGYSIIGTDISVSDVDNSINSTSTDLSGLLSDEWVYIEGFGTSDNNGWLQVDSNSTATKIIIKAAHVLVTEAASLQITGTGYFRGYDQEYTLELFLSAFVPKISPMGKGSISWGGVERGVLKRIDEIYAVSVFSDEDYSNYYNQWKEFISSVANRESFIFDKNGVIGIPDNEQVVKAQGNININPVGSFDYSMSMNIRVVG